MKQIVQSVSDGELRVVEVPQPEPGATEALVATRRSLLSAGTERAVRELASASLLAKARARPDLVRQVVSRARTAGVRSTLAAVRSRLDEDMPLGYSAAGVVVAAGAATDGLRPGMRVATASAGHAEYQAVPALLAVPVPEAVSDQAAAFGAVAAIALQGLRQAEVGVGGSVAVVGLGLVGQLTVRLGLAAGLNVIGVDLRDWTAELATTAGATGLVEAGAATTDQILELTRGRGVDAVLITAATRSSEPVARSTEIARDRARLVVVGDVGLELDRRGFYERELDLRFARSYGPGRYDRAYEDWGVDYPVGHVRWTARRNIEAYLDLVASGRVTVDDLVTHVFDVERATAAYEVLAADPRSLAVQLSYAAPAQPNRTSITIRPRRVTSSPRAGLIGAGTYAKATFLPALKAAGWADDLAAVTSAKGLTARHAAERHGIPLVLPTADDLLARDDIDTVFILSRHDSHAELVVRALDAGKHVFVEKPLALTQDELDEVRAAYDRNSGHLFVGFNRRHAPMVVQAEKALTGGTGPLSITYRVNAGTLPDTHWYHDRRQGGRVRGEVCHFIDLASWLVGEQPGAVHAYGSGRGEPGLEEDVSVLLGYPDGSTATITYCTRGHRGTAKERLEILGRGHTVLIDDFRRLEIDGREVKRVPAGKGHREMLVRMRAAVSRGRPDERGLGASFGATSAALSVVAALAGVEGLPSRRLTQVVAAKAAESTFSA
ncbi:bi-domain-containing oxidoreductase [Micromonospora sp. PLK6-60]|uniref:bi-domain-containing oxidoreductase n=1 Tax=Micromonospora sp. PLK6-60 TaxID=2873383 RepID=UPI001CA7733C|nr:bi-domain-containing oxidoreductase [Micromonospora sp. PLK6-60]MBY8874821.1 bi-domain-containing oxidoreductase [Micromonospora sp. PLK6-60]